MMDLATQATGVAGERPGGGDVLHSVRTKRERHRDRHAERRQASQRKVRNHPGKERGRPHIWFFNTMFFHEQEQEWRTGPSRSGEGRGGKNSQNWHRRREVPRAEHVDKKHAGISQPTQNRATTGRGSSSHLCRRRCDVPQVEGRSSLFAPLEEVLTSQDGRIPQEEGQD